MYSFQAGPITIMAIVFLLILAIIPAKIAEKKGYSFLFHYILGILFFGFELILSLCLKNKNKKHVQVDQTESIEMYEQKYERGEISYSDFVSKKKQLQK